MTGAIDPAEPAARLRRIAACARSGQPIDPADGEPFAAGVDQFFAGDDLVRALGLRASGPGLPDARRQLLLNERDDALQVLAEHFGTSTIGADAEGIHDIAEFLASFEQWRWPGLRMAGTCPPSLTGADALAWTILRGNGAAPDRRWLSAFFRQRTSK